MEKKNIAIAMIIPAILIIAGGMAFAQENISLSQEDQKQISDFEAPIGAQFRMLQLERSITRNILVGSVVVNITEKNHPEANTTNMNIILDDMESLLGEVKTVDFGENLTVLAGQFVYFKKASINLTNEFRNESKKYLNATDRQEIVNETKNISDELKAIDDQIKIERKALNAKRIESILSDINATNPELIGRIQNGTANMTDVISAIQGVFASMDKNDKIGAVKNVRSHAVEAASIKHAVRNEVGKNLSSIMEKREAKTASNRLQERINSSEKESNWTTRQSRIINATGMSNRAAVMHNLSTGVRNGR